MSTMITRRRAITILAAAAGLPLLLKAGKAEARLIRWEGTMLGAPASLAIYHSDEAKARAAIEAGLAEAKRLEAIFSLFRADSAIAQLNRDGMLAEAPAELIEIAAFARQIAERSDGAFDPTVQPLWTLYFRHFTAATVDPAGPTAEAIAAARALVDWRGLNIDAGARRIGFAKPGMGLTLNGVAQGFVTDRVTEVLRAYGLQNMLVDMGEPRALSTKPDGSAWRIGIANPAEPAKAITEIEAVDQAVATSGGYGTLFDAEGRFTHLIDPKSGRTAPALAGVTVIAPTATLADALSTTLSVAPMVLRQAILSAYPPARAIFVSPQGVVATVSA
ncbi:MAG: FAD:protein FMN transferase [Rhodospirillales bacterium]|nr:FAD:protein FMN transferase [Rhodospirillales bacterium]